jgi:hypothetical protein
MPIKMVEPTQNMEIVKLSSSSKVRDIVNLGNQEKALAFETEENQLVFYKVDYKDIEGEEDKTGIIYLTECHRQNSRKVFASDQD